MKKAYTPYYNLSEELEDFDEDFDITDEELMLGYEDSNYTERGFSEFKRLGNLDGYLE